MDSAVLLRVEMEGIQAVALNCCTVQVSLEIWINAQVKAFDLTPPKLSMNVYIFVQLLKIHRNINMPPDV